MELNQKKKNRYLFLNLIYKDSGGSMGAVFSMWDVGEELNFNRDETQNIVNYLIGEHLIEARGLGGAISLTHWGIKEVEEALENPNEPTEHFLPINIINIGSMNNSSLQQATSYSTINFKLDNVKSNVLDTIISSLKEIQEKIALSSESRQELVSEIQTLEIQQKSPKPKSIIIGESLKTIRTILEGVASSAVTPIIIEQITKILT